MKYKTLFRLGLKIIGVLFVVGSLPHIVDTLVTIIWTLISEEGEFEYSGWVAARVVQHSAQLAVGLYLFFGGAWIADRAIPSNRPYCHECGYELKGLPADGLCPECGTAYRIPFAAAKEGPSAEDG